MITPLKWSLRKKKTYHCPLFVGEEHPNNGLLRGARVGSGGVSGHLQNGQVIGGRGKGLSPPSCPTTSHLDLQKGWHGGGRAGEVCTVAHSLQQLLLPLLQGVQFTCVLFIGLTMSIDTIALTPAVTFTKVTFVDLHSLKTNFTSRYIEGGLCSPPNLSRRASRCSCVSFIICLIFQICEENDHYNGDFWMVLTK